eukprot:TRINITY_DN20174_c0_g1_i3.p1 TRINITY_DN20174_c0_g1~~TRINITY_DN20174_c0_g1_i3.p1  ORF type:complete len:195 (+),score=44.50 TRINITY_DN20174_c0_g1_i3:204-788(+)
MAAEEERLYYEQQRLLKESIALKESIHLDQEEEGRQQPLETADRQLLEARYEAMAAEEDQKRVMLLQQYQEVLDAEEELWQQQLEEERAAEERRQRRLREEELAAQERASHDDFWRSEHAAAVSEEHETLAPMPLPPGSSVDRRFHEIRQPQPQPEQAGGETLFGLPIALTVFDETGPPQCSEPGRDGDGCSIS